MVFHCFSWLSGATGKENEKNENFLEFLKISWFGVRICNFESKFSFFFICNFIFFHFPLFLMVFHCFHCFSWLSWISGATGKENEKKMKKMKISSFLKISWFGVRICNFESKFSFFFHLQLHFFSFSFVFDGFPLFFIVFHGFPGIQVPRARKMKKK